MIKRRFLNYRTYNAFKADLDNQEISDESIVFIQDNLRIWAHGKEYFCEAGSDSAIEDGILKFNNRLGRTVFAIGVTDGNLVLTDSTNKQHVTSFVLKSDFDSYKTSVTDALSNLGQRDDSLQSQINSKADAALVQELIRINTKPDPTIDSELDKTSTNAVQNLVIANALDTKADVTDLQGSTTQLQQQIATKQNVLRAGEGIDITDNVISSTIDTNMWILVDELPTTDIDENKIYLKEEIVDGTAVYVEYRYKTENGVGQWVPSGQRSPKVDLSGYQRVGDYILRNEVAESYLSKSDAANTYQQKGDFVEFDDLAGFRLSLDSIFQKKGNYALASDVSAALTLLQTVIDTKYVLKKDVYNPEDGEFSSSEPTQITVGSSDGSSTGGNNSGTSGASNMITLTTAQYEALVKANAIDQNTYYFTYEETTWGFGDRFPVTFTDGDTSDSIGTFPINLE